MLPRSLLLLVLSLMLGASRSAPSQIPLNIEQTREFSFFRHSCAIKAKMPFRFFFVVFVSWAMSSVHQTCDAFCCAPSTAQEQ